VQQVHGAPTRTRQGERVLKRGERTGTEIDRDQDGSDIEHGRAPFRGEAVIMILTIGRRIDNAVTLPHQTDKEQRRISRVLIP
jgi:hypothetical protein